MSNPEPLIDPDAKPPRSVLVTIGGVILMAVVTCMFSWADDASYFGFSHARMIDVFTLGMFPYLELASIVFFWRYVWKAPHRKTGRIIFTGIFGLVMGALLACVVHMFATLIDHAVLFRPAITKTLASIELSIAYAHVKNETDGAMFVKIPAIPQELRITADDYHAMVTAQKTVHPEIATEWLTMANTYCARVTIQLAGQSGRVLHASGVRLPTGTVQPCPAIWDPMSEHLPSTPSSSLSGFTFFSD